MFFKIFSNAGIRIYSVRLSGHVLGVRCSLGLSNRPFRFGFEVESLYLRVSVSGPMPAFYSYTKKNICYRVCADSSQKLATQLPQPNLVYLKQLECKDST